MSYSDSQPSFIQTQLLYQLGSDAIDVCPRFLMNINEQFDQHQPPHRRPKTFEDNNNQSLNSRLTQTSNLPVNRGTAKIFFKTRMCAKFRNGTCRNRENCNFAHGMQDLRKPPPNWQELLSVTVRNKQDRPMGNWDGDHRIIHKMKLCKKFYNGEDCPYGDRCNFLHEDPARFRDDVERFRESSAISIGTTIETTGQASVGFNVAEGNKPVKNSVSDAFRTSLKPVYWKTKLCTKWEVAGHCPFRDKCYFAHGQAELQVPTGGMKVEAGNASSVLVNNASPGKTASEQIVIEEGQGNKCLLKWKRPKKINWIYGDWIDDLPLVHNLTNQVES